MYRKRSADDDIANDENRDDVNRVVFAIDKPNSLPTINIFPHGPSVLHHHHPFERIE